MFKRIDSLAAGLSWTLKVSSSDGEYKLLLRHKKIITTALACVVQGLQH